MNNTNKNIQSYVLQIIILLFFLIGSLLLVFYTFRTFIWPIFLSYLIYAAFDGVNKRFLSLIKNKSITALIMILLIFFIIFLPLVFFLVLLINQLIDFISLIQNLLEKKDLISYLFLVEIDHFLKFITNDPFFWINILENIYNFSKEYSDIFNYFSLAKFIGRAYDIFIISLEITIKIIIYIALTFLLLFFLFKDAHRFYVRLSRLLPFEQELMDEFKNELKQVVSVIFKGNILIAILQGFFLGIGFLIVGIPNVLLYGFLGSIFSIIPILGTSIVWIPAVLYIYFIKQSPGWAIFLGLYSLISFLTLENIVKPKLLDKQIGVPSILLFLAILGGLKEFGISGLILGPMILALFMIVWRLYPTTK